MGRISTDNKKGHNSTLVVFTEGNTFAKSFAAVGVAKSVRMNVILYSPAAPNKPQQTQVNVLQLPLGLQEKSGLGRNVSFLMCEAGFHGKSCCR